MKSAYELAMERLEKVAPSKPLTDEQRAAIAEIDSRAKAKMAEKQIFLGGEIAKAEAMGDMNGAAELRDQLRRELRRLELDMEDEKTKVRDAG